MLAHFPRIATHPPLMTAAAEGSVAIYRFRTFEKNQGPNRYGIRRATKCIQRMCVTIVKCAR